MIELKLVHPKDLTDDDIAWLATGCKGSFDGTTPLGIVHLALEGEAGIHRITGDAEGVVVLEPHGKTFTITALAGRNVLRHFGAVHDAILATAKKAGAEKVNGFVTRAGLSALYKKRTNARLVPMFIEDIP